VPNAIKIDASNLAFVLGHSLPSRNEGHVDLISDFVEPLSILRPIKLCQVLSPSISPPIAFLSLDCLVLVWDGKK
jgi:hypothetical protein